MLRNLASALVVPLENPLGFGGTDLLAFSLAAAFALYLLLWNPWIDRKISAFAQRTAWCMALLAILPVALRLALLPNHPVPTPTVYDEFSHLLLADTLLHFRLANPAHPMHRFFETFFVLQEPTYSSIYTIGQGLMLAIGRAVSGQPWTGVLISLAALCSLTYWMLHAWTTPRWALLGGLLTVAEFGPLNSWTNSYWGGTLAAACGCLVFGSLPRLESSPRKRDAVFLGLGLGLHWLTRPFETILLFLSIVFYLSLLAGTKEHVRNLLRVAPGFFLVIVPLILVTLLHNHAVTRSWTTLSEALSQYQYGVPTTLTIQPPLSPHRELTPQQQLDYRAQTLTHGPDRDTLGRFLLRLEYRIRYYRFFFLPPLYGALVAFLFTLRERRSLWILGTLAIFAVGTNLFPYLLVHYLAAATCLLVLVSIIGLQQLSKISINGMHVGREATRIIVFLCAAHFLLWYGFHLFENSKSSTELASFETWDVINHRTRTPRAQIVDQLAAMPGKQLVFVQYSPHHMFQDEWVWNAAEIDVSQIVFARDLGPVEDQELCRYYPDRKVWLLQPDERPPRLSPYDPGASMP